jgi:hypothetical protein
MTVDDGGRFLTGIGLWRDLFCWWAAYRTTPPIRPRNETTPPKEKSSKGSTPPSRMSPRSSHGLLHGGLLLASFGNLPASRFFDCKPHAALADYYFGCRSSSLFRNRAVVEGYS